MILVLQEVEFDLSPKTWMLKLMRHLRVLRAILPSWHKKEKQINTQVRNQIKKMVNEENIKLDIIESFKLIKGYREVRYERAESKGILL